MAKKKKEIRELKNQRRPKGLLSTVQVSIVRTFRE